MTKGSETSPEFTKKALTSVQTMLFNNPPTPAEEISTKNGGSAFNNDDILLIPAGHFAPDSVNDEDDYTDEINFLIHNHFIPLCQDINDHINLAYLSTLDAPIHDPISREGKYAEYAFPEVTLDVYEEIPYATLENIRRILTSPTEEPDKKSQIDFDSYPLIDIDSEDENATLYKALTSLEAPDHIPILRKETSYDEDDFPTILVDFNQDVSTIYDILQTLDVPTHEPGLVSTQQDGQYRYPIHSIDDPTLIDIDQEVLLIDLYSDGKEPPLINRTPINKERHY
ncbi:hypothetical protein TWF281_003806 [Arthrobotrys megalospora]